MPINTHMNSSSNGSPFHGERGTSPLSGCDFVLGFFLKWRAWAAAAWEVSALTRSSYRKSEAVSMHSNGSLVFRMNYVASERSPSGKIFALLIHNPITRHTRHAGTHTHTSHTHTRTHTHIHLYIHTHSSTPTHIHLYPCTHWLIRTHARSTHTWTYRPNCFRSFWTSGAIDV